MANKFIIHGATFNGDGTASNEAASAGAPGAWNNINIFTGTTPANGSLDAGDVVYIRSKTSAGADVTVGIASSTFIGKANTRVTWIVDDGVIWTGVSGVLTFEVTATISSQTWVKLYGQNVYIGNGSNLRFVIQAGNAVYTGYLVGSSSTGGTQLIGAIMDNTAGTNITYSPAPLFVQQTQHVVVQNCTLKTRKSACVFQYDDYNAGFQLTLMGCTYEIDSSYALAGLVILQSQGSGQIEMIGGEFRGDGLIPGRALFQGLQPRGVSVIMHGVKYPRTTPIYARNTNTQGSGMVGYGADGIGGISADVFGGTYDSRDDGFYPYLNASLPDTNPVSICARASLATSSSPLILPALAKFYNQSSATRTITLELLVNSAKSPTNDQITATVSYIDSSGVTRCEGFVIDGSALVTSTAAWSATSYGPVSFNKYKLQHTTAYAIKSGTVVTLGVAWAISALNTDDVGFIDPDFSIT